MSLKLLFELSKAGSNKFALPEIDVPVTAPSCGRKSDLLLPDGGQFRWRLYQLRRRFLLYPAFRHRRGRWFLPDTPSAAC